MLERVLVWIPSSTLGTATAMLGWDVGGGDSTVLDRFLHHVRAVVVLGILWAMLVPIVAYGGLAQHMESVRQDGTVEMVMAPNQPGHATTPCDQAGAPCCTTACLAASLPAMPGVVRFEALVPAQRCARHDLLSGIGVSPGFRPPDGAIAA